MAWPARYGDHILRCPVMGHEPVVAVLLRDLKSRRHKQQLEFGREVHMACKVGDDALGQRALVEPVVDQSHIGALQVWLVRSRAASQESRLFREAPACGIDVEIDQGAWSYALGFGQGRQVRHADIENEDAAWTEETKRGRPGATSIVEREQMRHRATGNDNGIERIA